MTRIGVKVGAVDNFLHVSSVEEFEREKWNLLNDKDSGIPKDTVIEMNTDDLAKYQALKAKEIIDAELINIDISPREQIVTTANGLQFALLGLSTLVDACSKSSDKALKEAAQPLLPFAISFLQARATGDMPIDVLGLESVAEKIISTSIKSGKIVKQVLNKK